jgi:hypothetical protein
MPKTTISNGQSSASVRAALNTMHNELYAGQIVTPNIYYVTIEGNDGTGDGSITKPFLTAQKAFNVAYVANVSSVIDLGIGSFGNVYCPATGWPAIIGLSGKGNNRSLIEIISSNDQSSPGVSTAPIYIDGLGCGISSIISSGYSGSEEFENGGDAGVIDVSGISVSHVIANGGGAGPEGTFGSNADIFLRKCDLRGLIAANGNNVYVGGCNCSQSIPGIDMGGNSIW